MMTISRLWCDWVVLLLLLVAATPVTVVVVQGQQSYVDNKQLDCYNDYNTTDGYVCNGIASSCLSYLTFRSLPPFYNSPSSIAYLLNSLPTQIASANNVSDVDPIPTGTPVIVPVNCSCFSNNNYSYYQHNSSYVLKSSDTYFGIANNTYQGLTTCQSLMAQNPFDAENLTVGLSLQVPLRCACPTANQNAAGVLFLLSYIVTWGDEPSTIADRFGIDRSTLLQANRLSSSDIIYPFTPILVPLTTKPSPSQLQLFSPPPPPPPSSPPAAGNSSSSSNKKWIFVGVGVGAACLLTLLVLAFFLFHHRRHPPRHHYPSSPKSKLQVSSSSGHRSPDHLNMPTSLPSSDTKSWSSTAVSSRGLRHAVESLSVYTVEELQRATQFFSEANRINKHSSVFKGSFEGDEAAIKVVKGEGNENEINLLKRINHSNIIRLSGFCVHEAHTYLVYEYAPSGSLADCLHHNMSLSWKQRVQIAHDVADALNYLHNFSHPPCIHNNLKTSNILLDANWRAKVSNFGLARAVDLDYHRSDQDSQQEQALQLTRHVVGTHGYMAPEYIQNGVITPKLDVFAFGVVLLELLSGREAVAAAAADGIEKNSEEVLLSASINGVLEGDRVREKLEGFMDPYLKREYPLELAFSMAQLAQRCVAPQVNSRPSMGEAFITLSKILSSTLNWEPSDSDQLEHSTSITVSRANRL
ncbi:protein LYK5 [Pyrus x bretschneideri]|uniref:protein LYK5 n=1 Tax=Pyrus x bretschneideri TaxID=225117 RepID=UPI00202ED66C|nr:protein LYK5 [Pyrus x bretschneideri]